jgi:hypothetical protein
VYGKPDLLRFALDQDPTLFLGGGHMDPRDPEGYLACLKLLHERGFEISFTDQVMRSDNAECLEYILSHSERVPRDMLRQALFWNAPNCLQLLYDKGYLPRSQDVWAKLERFARDVKLCRRFECIKVLVANSGRPDPRILSTAEAASHGLDCLRFVRELGAAWERGTLHNASKSEDMLRYARENGCPWGYARLSDFVGSLGALRYAHEQGCPYDKHARIAHMGFGNFEVLRYICESTDPKWGRLLVTQTLQWQRCCPVFSGGNFWYYREDCFLSSAYHNIIQRAPPMDWRVPLYLLKRAKIAREIMGPFARLADDRQDRAEALAQCFTGAAIYVREGRGGPAAGCWAGMAKCPPHIVELIAMKAKLALPRGGEDP